MARYAIALGEYMKDRLEPLGFRYTKKTRQWVIDDPAEEVLQKVEKLHPERLFQKDDGAKRVSTPDILWIDKAFNNGHRLKMEAVGARWDKVFGAWYIEKPSREQATFLYRHGLTVASPESYPDRRSPRVATKINNAQSEFGSGVRVYLSVPYDHKDAAKGLGCFWDKEAKKWFSLLDNPHLSFLKSRYGEKKAA